MAATVTVTTAVEVKATPGWPWRPNPNYVHMPMVHPQPAAAAIGRSLCCSPMAMASSSPVVMTSPNCLSCYWSCFWPLLTSNVPCMLLAGPVFVRASEISHVFHGPRPRVLAAGRGGGGVHPPPPPGCDSRLSWACNLTCSLAPKPLPPALSLEPLGCR